MAAPTKSRDEFGGVAVLDTDDFGGVAVAARSERDEFGGVPVAPETTSNQAADFARRIPEGMATGTGRTIQGLARAADIAQDTPPIPFMGGFGMERAAQTQIKVNQEIAAANRVRSATRQQRMEESPTYQFGAGTVEAAQGFYGVDRARDDEFVGQLATAAGEMVPTLVTGAFTGPIGAGVQYAGSAGESQAQEAIAAGREDVADIAFLSAAGIGGLTEAVLGVPGRLLAIANRARKAGVPPGKFGQWANRNPLKAGVVRAGAEGGAREAGQEGLEQVGGNLIASDVAGYDPDRPAMQGVGRAMALGGVLGLAAGGGGAAVNQLSRNQQAGQLRAARTVRLTADGPELIINEQTGTTEFPALENDWLPKPGVESQELRVERPALRGEAAMETRPSAEMGLDRTQPSTLNPEFSTDLADTIAALRAGYRPEVEQMPVESGKLKVESPALRGEAAMETRPTAEMGLDRTQPSTLNPELSTDLADTIAALRAGYRPELEKTAAAGVMPAKSAELQALLREAGMVKGTGISGEGIRLVSAVAKEKEIPDWPNTRDVADYDALIAGVRERLAAPAPEARGEKFDIEQWRRDVAAAVARPPAEAKPPAPTASAKPAPEAGMEVVGTVKGVPPEDIKRAVMQSIMEGGAIEGMKRDGSKDGHYVVIPKDKLDPESQPMAIGPFKDKSSAATFLEAEVGAPGAKVVQVKAEKPAKPGNKKEPVLGSGMKMTEVRPGQWKFSYQGRSVKAMTDGRGISVRLFNGDTATAIYALVESQAAAQQWAKEQLYGAPTPAAASPILPSTQPKKFQQGSIHINLRGGDIDTSRPLTGWVLPAELGDYPNVMSTRFGKPGATAIWIPREFVTNIKSRPDKIKEGYFPKPEHIAIIPDEAMRPSGTVDWAKVFKPAPDRIETLLDAAEAKLKGPGGLMEGVTGLPVWVTREAARGVIKVMRVAYLATRDIAAALRAGLDWLRKQNLKGFIEAEANEFITGLVRGEWGEGSMDGNKTDGLKLLDGELDLGFKSTPTVFEIAMGFQDRFGRAIDYTNLRPEDNGRLVASLVQEIKRAVKLHPEALGWYDENLNLAMDVMRDLDPDLAKPENNFIFKAILAATSDGNKVGPQFKQTWQEYSHWKKHHQIYGGFVSGDRGENIRLNLGMLNDLIAHVGWEQTRDFMVRKGTVAELRQALVDVYGWTKEEANKIGTAERIDERVPFAIVLGPKLGSFFANLYGDYSSVTMDRWFMRTIGRLTGTLAALLPEGKLREMRNRLRDAVSKLTPEQFSLLNIPRGRLVGSGINDSATTISGRFAKKELREVAQQLEELGQPALVDVRLAANALKKGLKPMAEAPDNGTHRRWIRERVDEVQQILKADGIEMENADLQAVLWYLEKELYEKLKYRIKKGDNDYAAAANSVYEAIHGRQSPKYTRGLGRIRAIGDGSKAVVDGAAEGRAAPVRSQEQVDSIEATLDSLESKLKDAPDSMLEGVTGAPVWLTKAALRGVVQVVRVAYRASKDLALALRAGLEWLRDQNLRGFDEAQAHGWLAKTITEGSSVDGLNIRATSDLLAASPLIPDEVREMIANVTYEVVTDKNATDFANRILDALGDPSAALPILADASNGLGGKRRTVLAFLTLLRLSQAITQAKAAGDTATVQRLAQTEAAVYDYTLADRITDAAQTLQAVSVFSKLSPEGRLIHARRRIQRAGDRDLDPLKAQLNDALEKLEKAKQELAEETARGREIQQQAAQAIADALEAEAQRARTALQNAIHLNASNSLEMLPSVWQKAQAAVLQQWHKLGADELVKNLTGRAGQALENSLWSAVQQKGGAQSTVASVIAQVNRALHEQVNRALNVKPEQFINPATYAMRLRHALGNAEVMSRIWEQTRAAVGANLRAIGEMEGLLLRIGEEIALLEAQAKLPLEGGPEVTATDAKLRKSQQGARDAMLAGRNAGITQTIVQKRERLADVEAQLAEYRKMEPAWRAVLAMTVDVWGPNLIRGVMAEQMKADGFRLRKAVSDHFRGLAGAPDPMQSLGTLTAKIVAASGLDEQAAGRLAASIEAEFVAQVEKERAKVAERIKAAAVRKAARAADAPRREAVALIDSLQELQTEWLKPPGKRSAIRALVQDAIRSEPRAKALNEAAFRGTVQSGLVSLGVPEADAARLAYETWLAKLARDAGIEVKLAAEAARKAARAADAPRREAESLIDSLQELQTEWLRPPGKRSAIQALVRQAIRSEPGAQFQDETAFRNAVQAGLVALGVPEQSAARLAYETWQAKQARDAGREGDRLDQLIRERMDALKLNLGKLVREHWSKVERAGESLAEQLAGEGGLTPEGAQKLAAAFERRFNQLAQAKLKRELEQVLKPVTRSAIAKPGLVEKLMGLLRLGAFSNEAYWKAVMERLKLPEFSEALRDRLTAIGARLDALPEADIEGRHRVSVEFLNALEQAAGIDPLDLSLGFYVTNLLTGIPTHVANTSANFFAAVANAGIQMERAIAEGRYDDIPAAIEAAAVGLKKALPQAGQVMRTGILPATRDGQARALRPMELAQFGTRGGVPLRDTGAVSRGAKWALETYPAKILNLWKLNGRAMAAEDLLAFTPAMEVQRVLLARRVARAEGLRGEALRNRVAGLLADSDPAQVEDAREFALRVVNSATPYGLVGAVVNLINQAKGSEHRALRGAANIVAPVLTIPMNAFNESLNYTPVGLWRRRSSVTNLLGRDVKNLSLEQQQDLRAELLAKALTGTLFLTATALMFAQFLDDDDPALALYGTGPQDMTDNKGWRERGALPHSLKVGNTYFSFALTPIAAPLSALGNYFDRERDVRIYGKKRSDSLGTQAGVALLSSLDVLFEQPFMVGFVDLFRLAGNTQGSDETKVRSGFRRAAKTASSFVVPNEVRNIDRYFDPKVYPVRDLEGALISSVPFVRGMGGKPALNALGQPIESQPFHRFLSRQASDPLIRGLDAKGAWPTVLDDRNKVWPAKRRAMTEGEFYSYQAETGKALDRKLRAEWPAWSRLPDAIARDKVAEAATKERAIWRSRNGWGKQ